MSCPSAQRDERAPLLQRCASGDRRALRPPLAAPKQTKEEKKAAADAKRAEMAAKKAAKKAVR